VWGKAYRFSRSNTCGSMTCLRQMFQQLNWGGYLHLGLYPTACLCGRPPDLYAFNGVLDDYVQVQLVSPGWQEILDRYNVGYVVTGSRADC